MRLATIGTGWITEMFISAALESGKYELFAVYSRDMEKAKEFAQKHGASNAYNSLEELAASDAEIVYIASPNITHFGNAEIMLKGGKHVICEKPIVTRKDRFNELIDTAKQNGVYVFEALRHLHTPGFKYIAEKLDEISPIRCVNISYNQYSSKFDGFKQGKIASTFNPELDGGAKFDLGVYTVSTAIGLFGAPKKSDYFSIKLENGIDGAGTYVLEYDGFLCNLTFSKITEGEAYSEIMGENGSVMFDKSMNFDELIFCKRGEAHQRISLKNYENTMRYEAEGFYNIIKNEDTKEYERLTEISKVTSDILVQ